MNKRGVLKERLLGLFLLGGLLFNYPILAVFDRPATMVGVPVLYAYVFGAWALYVVLAALVMKKK